MMISTRRSERSVGGLLIHCETPQSVGGCIYRLKVQRGVGGGAENKPFGIGGFAQAKPRCSAAEPSLVSSRERTWAEQVRYDYKD